MWTIQRIGIPQFRKKYNTRGVIHTWANPDGTQKIESTGPLTKKRMETIDEEVTKASLDYLEKQAKKAGQALFPLVELHPDAYLYPPEEGKRRAKPGSAPIPTAWSSTIRWSDSFLTSSRSWASTRTPSSCTPPITAPSRLVWPDGGTTPFRGEKATNWEGGFRVPTAIRWPGRHQARHNQQRHLCP